MKNLDRRLRESGSQYFLLGLKTLKIGWIEFEESGSMVDSRGISGDLSCFCVLSFVLILLCGEDEVKAHTLVYIRLFYIHLFFIYLVLFIGSLFQALALKVIWGRLLPV